jgi:HTH-type transcriptional regulator/antitoxin HigA
MPEAPAADSLRALMEERGLRHKDIWPILGNKGAATEILNGRRSISKAQAKRLAEFCHVPIE